MPADLDYKDLFRDAVHMLAYIARAAGFHPDDPTVEPPAIVARVETLRANLAALRLEHEAWGVQLDAARRDQDTARQERDALQARLAALAAPVEGVDVEEVLEDFGVYQRLDAEGNHPPNRVRMEAILGRLGRQAPALAREVVALRDALGRAQSALGGEIELRRCAEQERDTANARLTAIVEAYQDSTGSQTTAELLPADIASLAENEGRLAATCDTYEEFMRDLLVAIGADPTAWDTLDEQVKAVEHAKAIVRERDALAADKATG